MKIRVFFVFHCVGMPIPDVRSERVEQDIRLTDQGFHPGRPLIGIRLYILEGALAEIDMSPAVGGELPAVVPETLCHLADCLFICLIIRVRTFIGRICPVS